MIIAKFLNGPLAGTERALEDSTSVYSRQFPNLKAMLVEEPTDEFIAYETVKYLALPHVFVDQKYTYYTLERKYTDVSPTDSTDITRHLSSD